MLLVKLFKQLLPTALVAGLVIAGYFTRENWLPWVMPSKGKPSEQVSQVTPSANEKVLLSDQAITNLGLKSLPLLPATYWKSITVPGMIVDRPGQSDRGVVSPIMGVIQTVHHFPGESVSPGETLFTLRLLSETLHQAQSELYKTAQSIKLAQAQRQRLVEAGNAIPEVRLIEKDQEIARLEISVKTLRAELGTRGFSPEQINGAAEGRYVKEI
ncbi:MAG TPA: hypothetical protein PLX97_16820, partial [Gemmatales bacterium]|nr:hypothetical protein [Gemmatales bacterium]